VRQDRQPEPAAIAAAEDLQDHHGKRDLDRNRPQAFPRREEREPGGLGVDGVDLLHNLGVLCGWQGVQIDI